MTFVATLPIDPAVAPVFAATGLAARLASPLFRSREAMLTAQLCAASAHATSYALLGQDTATAVCLIGAIQTTLALMAGERAWLCRSGYVFLPLVIGIGALTWSGLPTVLAVCACCLTMIGRLQRDTLRFRAVQILAVPFNAAHDICVGAWVGLASTLVTATAATLGLRREFKTRRTMQIAA